MTAENVEGIRERKRKRKRERERELGELAAAYGCRLLVSWIVGSAGGFD
jgi:hypothetical protein